MENVKSKWIPELMHHCPEAPIVLVGTKLDMRKPGVEAVSTEEGKKLMEEIGAVGYCECSAKTQEGLKDVFIAAIAAVVKTKDETEQRRKQQKKAHKCEIL